MGFKTETLSRNRISNLWTCDYVLKVERSKFGGADNFSENRKSITTTKNLGLDSDPNGSITRVRQVEFACSQCVHFARRFE